MGNTNEKICRLGKIQLQYNELDVKFSKLTQQCKDNKKTIKNKISDFEKQIVCSNGELNKIENYFKELGQRLEAFKKQVPLEQYQQYFKQLDELNQKIKAKQRIKQKDFSQSVTKDDYLKNKEFTDFSSELEGNKQNLDIAYKSFQTELINITRPVSNIEIENLYQNCDKSYLQIKDKISNFERLEDELKTKKQIYIYYQKFEELENLKQNEIYFQEKFRKLEDQYDTLEYECLELELKKQIDENRKLKQEIKEYQQSIKDFEQENTMLIQKIQDQEIEYSQQIQILEEQRRMAKEEAERKSQLLQESINTYVQRILIFQKSDNQLKEMLNFKSKIIKEMKQNLEDNQNQITRLQNKKQRLEEKVLNQEKTINEHKETINKINEKNKQYKNRRIMLQSQIDYQKQLVKEQNVKLDQQTHDIGNLKQKLDRQTGELQQKIQNLEKDSAQFQKVIENKDIIIKQLNENLTKIQEEIKLKEQNFEERKQKIEQQKSELETLCQQMKDKRLQEVYQLKQNIKKAHLDMEKQQQEIDNLKRDYQFLKSDITTLKQDYHKQLLEKDNSIKNLTSQLSKEKDENIRLRSMQEDRIKFLNSLNICIYYICQRKQHYKLNQNIAFLHQKCQKKVKINCNGLISCEGLCSQRFSIQDAVFICHHQQVCKKIEAPKNGDFEYIQNQQEYLQMIKQGLKFAIFPEEDKLELERIFTFHSPFVKI